MTSTPLGAASSSAPSKALAHLGGKFAYTSKIVCLSQYQSTKLENMAARQLHSLQLHFAPCGKYTKYILSIGCSLISGRGARGPPGRAAHSLLGIDYDESYVLKCKLWS